MRRQIRDLQSEGQMPTRFCDAVVEEGKIYLEQKINKRYVKIAWEDVVYQVNALIKDTTSK